MIVNLQRKIKLSTTEFEPFLAALRSQVGEAEGGQFAVAFVSDRRMRELNKIFRGKDSTTDVLSFPHTPDEFEAAHAAGFVSPEEFADKRFLGDIVISTEQAQKQAAENGLTLDLELKQLILHGLLHLCGYDHETDTGQMNSLELKLRKKLRI